MGTKTRSSLVASGNTYNPSLIVLRDNGYAVRLENGRGKVAPAPRDGDHDFPACSGPESLGLATLWERLGDGWDRQSPDVYSELIEKMAV